MRLFLCTDRGKFTAFALAFGIIYRRGKHLRIHAHTNPVLLVLTFSHELLNHFPITRTRLFPGNTFPDTLASGGNLCADSFRVDARMRTYSTRGGSFFIVRNSGSGCRNQVACFRESSSRRQRHATVATGCFRRRESLKSREELSFLCLPARRRSINRLFQLN